MQDQDAIQPIFDRIDDFVSSSLKDYVPRRHSKDKAIRDAIWGTNRIYPWEIAVLDSPLLQRLRDIRQTGLAYLVYPTAQHSRFDHTIGMVTIASRIVRSINDKHMEQQKDPVFKFKDHMAIRLSAILHDVGHSCFSHVSESVYASLDEFQAVQRYIYREYGVTPKPHEIMSWLIVRSQPFKDFILRLGKEGILKDWVCDAREVDAIAGNIIGFRANPAEKFIADVINGPMDADKLDYLVRDAYFAGPRVVYDLERFLDTIDVETYPRHPDFRQAGQEVTKLAIRMEGVTALEQIIISKLMLFSYVYHHHKIRCVEAMFQEALKRLVALGRANQEEKVTPWLGDPIAFLRASDRTLLPLEWPLKISIRKEKVAGEILTKLAKRELYKRALIVSRLFIKDIDAEQEDKRRKGFEKLLKCSDDTEAREDLRNQIYDRTLSIMKEERYRSPQTVRLLKSFKIHHLFLDIPKAPSVEETVGVMVPVGSALYGGGPEWVPLIDVFPIEKWVDAYNAIKWRGHVFALEEAAPYVNLAATQVLGENPFHLEFSFDATNLCKIPIP